MICWQPATQRVTNNSVPVDDKIEKSPTSTRQFHTFKSFASIVVGIVLNVEDSDISIKKKVFLPNGMFLQQPLDRDGQLPEEAFDDWPTFGKFVFHLDLQNISG